MKAYLKDRRRYETMFSLCIDAVGLFIIDSSYRSRWMHHFTPGGNSKKIKMAASDGDGQTVRPVTWHYILESELWHKYNRRKVVDRQQQRHSSAPVRWWKWGAARGGGVGSEKWKSELIVSSVLMRSADLLCHPASGSRQAGMRGGWLTQISLELIVDSSM